MESRITIRSNNPLSGYISNANEIMFWRDISCWDFSVLLHRIVQRGNNLHVHQRMNRWRKHKKYHLYLCLWVYVIYIECYSAFEEKESFVISNILNEPAKSNVNHRKSVWHDLIYIWSLKKPVEQNRMVARGWEWRTWGDAGQWLVLQDG